LEELEIMAADVATISVGLQSLKAAFDIGKALLNLGLNVQVQDRIREINDKILAAQESAIASRDYQSALLKQIGGLETQIAKLEAWEAEAQTYQLTDVGKFGVTGKFAYAPKEGTHTSEPAHLLCASCYHKRHKSILQTQHLQPGACETLICHHCASVIYIIGEPYPQHAAMLPKRSGR
jgi:hypothetical protein